METPSAASPKQTHRPKSKKNSGGDCNKYKLVPICLWEPHQSQGVRHLLKDCPECPEYELHRILKARADEKAKNGPS